MTTEPTRNPHEIALRLASELEMQAVAYGEARRPHFPRDERMAIAAELDRIRLELYRALRVLELSHAKGGYYASGSAPQPGDAPSEAPRTQPGIAP
jgi:hypothetical protein